MSTDQTTPPPVSATLTGVPGTAEPADTAPEAATADQTGADAASSQTMAGPAGSETMAGPAGSETMAGPAGSETMAGPAGSETMAGPAGSETTGRPVGEHMDSSVGEHPAGAAVDRTVPDEPVLDEPVLDKAGLDETGLDKAGLDETGLDETVPVGEPVRQPIGSSWQAEASGQLVAMSFPGARRIAGWLFWVVFPLLCIAAIHTSVTNVAHHLGNKPTGIRGTFVVQPRSCSQGFCSFGGLFTSDDHTIKNLPLLGDPRWHTADVLRVTYDPRSVEVIALPGHWDPTPSVMAAIGALTYLVLLGYFVREQRRSGRSWRRLASGA